MIRSLFTFVVLLFGLTTIYAAQPTPAEMYEAECWTRAKLEGIQVVPLENGTFVNVIENYDPVYANARQGKPLKIGDQQFTNGLYCHANSRLQVVLAEPAQTFEAVVGVDSNEQTSNGRGSVQFAVKRGNQIVWKSELLREGMSPVPVQIDLKGTQSFELFIDDGGDGISCDQADWANARVVLQSGKTVELGQLPLCAENVEPYNVEPFFSFDYNGESSKQFLKDWTFARSSKRLDDQRTEYTISYTDPKTGLQVSVRAVVYSDFPVVEWTLDFTNTGSNDTPIISNIKAIDTFFQRSGSKEFQLNGNKGDDCTADSFEPFSEQLGRTKTKHIANTGGRPTQKAFPYFNLECGEGGGINFILSWAGQWSADFIRNGSSGITLQAGQELTHFKLYPGESVRQPLIVLQFWKGDRLHAQNVWRSWMIAHNIPRDAKGQLPPLPMYEACSSHWYNEMIEADSESQKFFIAEYLRQGLKLDFWWMDAGWYPNQHGWPHTGTWEIDQNRFPGGFRPISDFGRERGVETIVWFEPERVTAETFLADEHPDWVLGGSKGGLLNLGNPDALNWLINHVDQLITKEGIDLYRQDFNMDPLDFWRKNDTSDRQGISEIRHIEGYLKYWDTLQERHPGMLIDSCASGGRRNDLETLRRAVPLLRSDYIMEPVGNQAHFYALANWFPFFGTGTSKTSSYEIRSVLGPSFNSCWDMRNPNLDYDLFKKLIDEWKEYGPLYFGDYYPITPYSLDNTAWIGWQFHNPKTEKGLIQVYRRGESPYETARFPLGGLSEDVIYTLRNLDNPQATVSMSGKELMSRGFSITIDEKPGTGFYIYEK
ncbi:MAG: NPCBM/NEW2 domain-containing protein [Thermoguttaceae bacterium]